MSIGDMIVMGVVATLTGIVVRYAIRMVTADSSNSIVQGLRAAA